MQSRGTAELSGLKTKTTNQAKISPPIICPGQSRR